MRGDRSCDRSSAGLVLWSDHIASLAVDALVEARLVRLEDFDAAAAIVSEEVWVRLCMSDYPPRSEPDPTTSDG